MFNALKCIASGASATEKTALFQRHGEAGLSPGVVSQSLHWTARILRAHDHERAGCAVRRETGKEYEVRVLSDEGLASHIGPRVMRIGP